MIKKIVFLISISLSTTAYAASGNVIKNDDDASDAAEKATVQYKLVPQSVTCLYFDTNDEGNDYLVRIREKHDDKCGGDPNTSPSLLFLKVRKSDGHITKMNIIDGSFQELSPVRANK